MFLVINRLFVARVLKEDVVSCEQMPENVVQFYIDPTASVHLTSTSSFLFALFLHLRPIQSFRSRSEAIRDRVSCKLFP